MNTKENESTLMITKARHENTCARHQRRLPLPEVASSPPLLTSAPAVSDICEREAR